MFRLETRKDPTGIVDPQHQHKDNAKKVTVIFRTKKNLIKWVSNQGREETKKAYQKTHSTMYLWSYFVRTRFDNKVLMDNMLSKQWTIPFWHLHCILSLKRDKRPELPPVKLRSSTWSKYCPQSCDHHQFHCCFNINFVNIWGGCECDTYIGRLTKALHSTIWHYSWYFAKKKGTGKITLSTSNRIANINVEVNASHHHHHHKSSFSSLSSTSYASHFYARL